ncbi:hypothetical protein [Photobacterium satsumensis]|uniref:hypothetical protein n=1 Tax=Photobacterium satsumensis TaxID=2910239 RepID=UPI003D0E1A9F
MKKLSLAILAASLIAGPAFALTDAELESAISAKLETQLKDKAVADYTAEFIMENLLTWEGEPLELSEADSIMAFAFGNRLMENGNQVPGPMNEQLADTVVEVYKATGKPVYAQWEIAQSIGDRIPADKLFSINPVIAADGTLTYLSSIGVADTAVQMAGGDLGKTVVVAFREHSLRTLTTAKAFGIDAYAPAGVELPHKYDTQSGQGWTRDQQTFVFHELTYRSKAERDRLIKEANK